MLILLRAIAPLAAITLTSIAHAAPSVGTRSALRDRDAHWAATNDQRAAFASKGDPAASIDASRIRVAELYERFELPIDVSGTWSNPFDPTDIAVDAEIRTPSGRTHSMPAFYAVDHHAAVVNDAEALTPTGERGWRLRLTLTEPGAHRVRIVVTDDDRRVNSDWVTIDCVTPATPAPGFVRVSENNSRYFEHDDGSLFFPIGLNHAWPGSDLGVFNVDRTLINLAANDGNTLRFWLGPCFHHLSLETSEKFDEFGHAGGLGWMNQSAAARVDRIVETAEVLGVKVIPVAFSFSGWRGVAFPRNWHESPYNAVNGGPIENAGDVFTDPFVRELNKRRLRYIVARWGASPAVMCWELWNEVSGVDDYDSGACAAWHAEMAGYLKSIDPHEHLVATSTWWTEGDRTLDGLDELDFTFTHEYNAMDHSLAHYAAARDKWDRHRKPHLVGEFGNQEFDSSNADAAYGPERIAVHNALWAGLTSGSAGGALYWYWSHGERDHWNRYFTPLADLVADVPLNKLELSPIDCRVASRGGAASESDALRIPGAANSWRPAPWNQPNTVRVDRFGQLDHPERVPGLIHPTALDRGNPIRFEFDEPTHPGALVVSVRGVSGWGGSRIEVRVDDEPLTSWSFDDDDEADKSEMSQFNGDYTATIPAGARSIEIIDTGKDWAYTSYRFEGVIGPGMTPVWLTAIGDADAPKGTTAALVWARHRDFHWGAKRAGIDPGPISGVTLTLPGFDRGDYEVEWIDTQTGAVIDRAPARRDEGELVFAMPTLEASLAAKITRVR